MTDESTKVKKSIFKKWWFWILAILAIIIIIANMGEKKSSNSSVESNKELELLDWKIKKGEYGQNVIVGKVKNNTDDEFSYVEVKFNLYDEDEALVGSAIANVNNLEANGIWKFEAVCLEENFQTAKFKGFTNF